MISAIETVPTILGPAGPAGEAGIAWVVFVTHAFVGFIFAAYEWLAEMTRKQEKAKQDVYEYHNTGGTRAFEVAWFWFSVKRNVNRVRHSILIACPLILGIAGLVWFTVVWIAIKILI